MTEDDIATVGVEEKIKEPKPQYMLDNDLINAGHRTREYGVDKAFELAQEAIAAGANPHTDNGIALHAAVGTGNPKIAKLLLDLGVA